MKARKRKNARAREQRESSKARRHTVNGLHNRWTTIALIQSVSERWGIPPSDWLLLVPWVNAQT